MKEKHRFYNPKYMQVAYITMLFCVFLGFSAFPQSPVRQDISLNKSWLTAEDDNNINAYDGFQNSTFRISGWKAIDVPHNWDEYEGYRRLKHGDKHGFAWYRKNFTAQVISGKRYFLYFEGVGSYATVWLNGKQIGYHAGGRTTFTLDVTDVIKSQNVLAVRADHPDRVQDLPWVCGGSSEEVGFSEGSQPMGIFRPVHLIATSPVRIQPFGVHIWNDTTVSERSATLNLETEVKNYGSKLAMLTISNKLLDKQGKVIAQANATEMIKHGEGITVPQAVKFSEVHLWSLQSPYLYKVVTEVLEMVRS